MLSRNPLRNLPRRRGHLACLAIVATAALGGAPPARAQDECQVPRFVLQSTVGANVMILADNSSSMNEVVYHPAYDPFTPYTGPFETDATYFVASDGWRAPNAFDAAWETEPQVYLVDSDNGQKGRYQGNYLNWVYYHATEAQLATLPTVTRVQVMKLVLCDIVDTSNRLRFGLTVFQNDHGGSIIGKCGSNPQSLYAQINGITANAWTPTGESMETILDYFAEDGPNAAIEQPCQHNFLIVITDGYPTRDREVSSYLWDADGDGNDPGSCQSIGAPYDDESYHCTDHMDDVAWYMAHNDLRPDLPDTQTVDTYVIGYHVDAPLLQETATNGGGLYFTARNANELRLSIEWAVQDIIRRISSGSAVAVVSTERGTDDRLFRGKFMPLSWDGYMESYALPYEDGDAPVWEAGEILKHRDTDTRWLFTALGDYTYDFEPGNAGTLWQTMDVPDQETAARLIDWGRGNDVEGLRDRKGWVLGDIVHSTPVVIGPPAAFHPEPEFMAFAQAQALRERVVYVGANDGMLHAFRAEDGHELWGFVPEFALPKFTAMADSFYCHTYSVDQTVTAQDVQVNGIWRTVLVGGSREGGCDLFALDVTYPESPQVLWQAKTPDGMPFPSEAVIATIGNGSMVLVGSGLDEAGGDAYLHAFDLDTGALLGSVLLSSTNDRNKATAPRVVDTNLDGTSDLVYIGDLDGSIWRVQLNTSESPAAWSVSELYRGSDPITARPAVAFGEESALYVYCGTGAYLDDDDMLSAEQNYFLGIIDRHDGNTATRNSLVDQTGGYHDIGNGDGWYLALVNEPGERITEPAVVAAQTVVVTSFAPTLTSCVSGGMSYLYRLRYDDGGQPQPDDGTDPPPRIQALGEGIASHPVVDLVSGNVVIQSSDASVHVEDIGINYLQLTVRAWHETFGQPPEQVQVP